MTIQCDPSNYGIGGVLLQEGRPIAFTSCALTSTEQNYTVIETECLAICQCNWEISSLHNRKGHSHRNWSKTFGNIFSKTVIKCTQKITKYVLKTSEI